MDGKFFCHVCSMVTWAVIFLNLGQRNPKPTRAFDRSIVSRFFGLRSPEGERQVGNKRKGRNRPKAVTGTLCALSSCRTLYVTNPGVFRRMMKKSFFQKQSIGFAALASMRDWVIFLGVVLGFLGLAEAALVWSHLDKDDLQIILIGTFLGMLPSVLMCLPVYGIVDELSRDALESFLRSIKFVRYSERNETRFCTQNTPTWMRWDSNRVTIRRLSNGQLSVTMPLYCYRILKQRN